MLRLQVLPAACGDCLWLEYGSGADTRVVIIDGGLRETAAVLRQRIDAACRARNAQTLDVELLVITHIDNDHILGIIELLKAAPPSLRVKDIWFNGRPQLMRLTTPPSSERDDGKARKARSGRPADMLGGGDDDEDVADLAASPSARDLLGPQQGDELSELLAARGLPWNKDPLWKGEALVVQEGNELPVVTLDGNLKLTLLGPTPERLYKLCTAWADVLGGRDEPAGWQAAGPADLLGRHDTWPPVWKDKEGRDPSAANGSSIVLLAEYGPHALLLAGDGHAPDLAAALDRLRHERKLPPATPFPLAAFKLSHHGSENNLTRALLERIDCCRYLVSTDGSASYRHPDHQALLRILRYSKRQPRLLFNYESETTRPWRDSKADVVADPFQDYEVGFPVNAADGFILELD
jgi:beta-lactamase superfamily II metal-dependent hydrolase